MLIFLYLLVRLNCHVRGCDEDSELTVPQA
jgi:hypothetical protein